MASLLPTVFDGFDTLPIPQTQSWQAVPLPISRVKQSLLWEQQGMIPPRSARDVPDTDDRDSLSARTVSSVENQHRSAVKAGRRVAGPGIVHTADANWRFLAATGDYTGAVPSAQPTLPRPPPHLPQAPQPPTLLPPTPHETGQPYSPASVPPVVVSPSQASYETVAAEAKAALSRAAVLLHLGQATAAALPEHAVGEDLHHHSVHSMQVGPSSLGDRRRAAPPVYHVSPNVLSRHSRVAFLAHLPSCEFTPRPRPRLPGTTRQTTTVVVSAAGDSHDDDKRTAHAASVRLNLAFESPGTAATAGASVVHNSPKNDALRRTRAPNHSAADLNAAVGSRSMSVVDLQTTQPPSPVNAAADIRSSPTAGASRTAATVDYDGGSGNRTGAAPRVPPDGALQATQVFANSRKSPVRPLVEVEEVHHKLLSPVSPSHAASSATPAGATPKSRRSSLSTRQLRMRDNMYTKAYRLLQDETASAEVATLQDVPLLATEALPVEEELVVRMQLQQWYLTLHPLDDVDVAEGLPMEMISKLAVTARGVAVNVICDKRSDKSSGTGKGPAAGAGVYCATRELDFVSYRQWHRPPGYVDPTLLVGSNDLETRTALISSLRERQREAEQYFGLQPTYTKIPPPLLPNEPQPSPTPPEGVKQSNKSSGRRKRSVGAEDDSDPDILLPKRQPLRSMTIDALEDVSASHPGKLFDLFHGVMFQSIAGP